MGAIALLGTTLVGAPIKLAVHAIRYGRADISWLDFSLVLVFVSVAGFACGIVGWAASQFSRKYGAFGDAIAGIGVVIVFFFLCMLAFDRPLLLNPSDAWPLWILATAVGIVGGPWLGRDLRRQLREQSIANRNSREVPVSRPDEPTIGDESPKE